MRNLAGLVAILILKAVAAWAQDDTDTFSVKFTDITPDMESTAVDALQGCPPHPGEPVAATNKNGVYTLIGDFFNDGHIYAILDRDSVMICEWSSGYWKLKRVLNLGAVWKYPGWNEETAGGREPDATKPFWIIKSQQRPVLVIAEDQEKEGQTYYFVLFDKDFRRIFDSNYSFGDEPKVRDDYIVTSDSSRVKATWDGTYFSQIKDDKFSTVKSWEESCPFEQPDTLDGSTEFDTIMGYIATSGSNSYVIAPDFTKGGDQEDYLVFKGAFTISEWGDIVYAPKYHPVYARIHFTPKRESAQLDSGGRKNELPYLFEKLTTLPRELCPEMNGAGPGENVEKIENIKVTGSREAVKLLSPGIYWFGKRAQ